MRNAPAELVPVVISVPADELAEFPAAAAELAGAVVGVLLLLLALLLHAAASSATAAAAPNFAETGTRASNELDIDIVPFRGDGRLPCRFFGCLVRTKYGGGREYGLDDCM